MNIDDAVPEPGNELRAQDLHVTREHDEIDAVLLEQSDLLGFLLELVLGGDGEHHEGDVHLLGR